MIKTVADTFFCSHLFLFRISTGAETWHTGRIFLEENAKPLGECALDEFWRGELHLELAQLEFLEANLKAIENQLDKIAKTNDQIRRVQTINGVGRVTAEAIVAYIDDPHRFKNGRQVSAYAGMVPRQYQSGNTCLLYTSPSPRDATLSRMPSSA